MVLQPSAPPHATPPARMPPHNTIALPAGTLPHNTMAAPPATQPRAAADRNATAAKSAAATAAAAAAAAAAAPVPAAAAGGANDSSASQSAKPQSEAALEWDGLSEEALLKTRKHLALMAAQSWHLTEAQAAAARDPSLTGKIRICVYPSTPYSFCNTTDPDTAFDGFEVKLFREVARRVPWLQFGDWAFQCVKFDDLDYAEDNGTCLISLGGLDSSNTFQTGLRSSYTTAESGWQILVRAHEEAVVKQLFSPFYAFTWQLWLALVVTALVVGICLWFFDSIVKWIMHRAEKRAEKLADLEEATFKENAGKEGGAEGEGDGKEGAAEDQAKEVEKDAEDPADADMHQSALMRRWRSMVKVSHEDEKAALQNLDKTLRIMLLNLARVTVPPPTTSLASQIVVWAWGILTMIVVSMFTGATAAGLTASQLTGGISSLADLRGKDVIVWDIWQQEFKFAGVNPIPIENLQDEARMLQALHDHKADALVMESNWVGYYSNKDCGLVPAGQVWDKVFLAFKFNIRMQSALEDDINAALVSCKIDDVFDQLEQSLTYQRSQGAGCEIRRGTSKGHTIMFQQVAGLWVLLGIAMVAGTAMLLATWFYQRSHPVIARSIGSAFRGAHTRRGLIWGGGTGRGGGGGGGGPGEGGAGLSGGGRVSFDRRTYTFKTDTTYRSVGGSFNERDEEDDVFKEYDDDHDDASRGRTRAAFNQQAGAPLGGRGAATFNSRGTATFNSRGAATMGREPRRTLQRAISAIDRAEIQAQRNMRQGRFTPTVDM